MAPILSQKGFTLNPGDHKLRFTNGRIEQTQTRDEARETVLYVNWDLEVLDVPANDDGSPPKLNYSCPAYITPRSALGKLLGKADMLPPTGEQWDETSLDGRECTARIVPDGPFYRPDPATFKF